MGWTPQQPSADEIDASVRRVQAGDAEAFATVVRAYEWPLRGWIAARCPGDCDPDDIAHRVFIAAFRGIRGYRPGTDLAAWLWAIARAQLLGAITDRRRRAARDAAHLNDLLAAELARRCEEGPEDDGRLDALIACRERLAAKDRELVDLRYRDGHAIEAIAAHFGRSAVAIRKHLFLLRRRLAECIARAADAGGADAR